MEENLYRVKIRTVVNDRHPQADHKLVEAPDASTALDILDDALEEPDTLYDEEIQRAIVNGEISESRISRNYADYIEEVKYLSHEG
jgi:hypothetical protein